jgi:hypothetical protein
MADFTPSMPEVDVPQDLEERFTKARLVASGQEPATPLGAPGGQRFIVVVTPGRTLMIQPCPRPDSIPEKAVHAIEKIAPAATPLNITVIAFTRLDALMERMSKAIPFLGYVMGLSYIGHNVIVFEGHPTALKAGCRDADMLIIDEAMIPHLQKDWPHVAWGVMRGSQIVIFGRNGTLKRAVRKPPQT